MAIIKAIDASDLRHLCDTISIATLDEEEHEQLKSIAMSMGFDSER